MVGEQDEKREWTRKLKYVDEGKIVEREKNTEGWGEPGMEKGE